MNVSDLFKDSFNYATKDWSKILILGAFIIGIFILTVITGASVVFKQYVVTAAFFVITLICLLIVGLVYNGYSLGIIRDTISNKNVTEVINESDNSLPEFDWSNNIMDGLKVLVLSIAYMLIPAIIGIILAFALGVFSDIHLLNQSLNIYNQTTGAQIPTSVTGAFLVQTQTAMFFVNVITTILSVLFTLIAIVAMGRLAETNKLSSIIEFGEIFETISNIGWGNYIVWFILFYVLLIVIAAISALVIFIPILGFIIYFLIIPGFLTVFGARAIGLIYNESKQ